MRRCLTAVLGLVLAGTALSCDGKDAGDSGTKPVPATQPVKIIPGVPPFQAELPKPGDYTSGGWRYEYREMGGEHYGTLIFDGKRIEGAKQYDRVLTPWGTLVWLDADYGFLLINYPSLTKEECEKGRDITPPVDWTPQDWALMRERENRILDAVAIA